MVAQRDTPAFVKSVRLGARIEARLREAARLARIPESRIIRDAVAERTDDILANRLDYQIARVFTLDSDFSIYRFRGRRALDLIPSRR